MLTVDSDTLYVDNGNSSDGMYDQTMGVYLDMGLGLSSALIPSSNTVTSPEASIILASNVSIEKTVEVTVQNIEGQNKYFFDGVVEENFELIAGQTYIFDWSGVPNHPLKFSTTTQDGTHLGGEEYTDGVVIDGTTTTITASDNTPLLYYYCENHDGMGTGDVTTSIFVTLDGTVGDVNAMPWMIELTDYDDVFIGRDAVYDSATNSYDPGNEVIIATYGSDMIDGGGGLNTADSLPLPWDQAMELTST